MPPISFSLSELLAGDARGFIKQAKLCLARESGMFGFALTDGDYLYLNDIMIILGAKRALPIFSNTRGFSQFSYPFCIILNDTETFNSIGSSVYGDQLTRLATLAYVLRRKEIFKKLLVAYVPTSSHSCITPSVPSLRVACEIHFARRLTEAKSGEEFDALYGRLVRLSDAILEKVISAVARAAQPLGFQTLWKLFLRLGARAHRVIDLAVFVQSMQQHSFLVGELYRAHMLPALPVKSLLFDVFEYQSRFVCPPADACGLSRIPSYFPSHTNARPIGKSSICESREAFIRNFSRFSHDQLRCLNWKNIAVLGGAVTACLLSDEERERRAEAFASSDIDLCIYGEDNTSLLRSQKLKSIYDAIVKAIPDVPVSIINTGEGLTFFRGAPYRNIQVLGAFTDMADVIRGIDIDCNAFCFDGASVYGVPRSLFSLNLRMNFADPFLQHIRGCPSYELRLLKYTNRGFSIGDLLLRRSKFQNLLSETTPPTEDFNFAWQGASSGSSCVPGVGQKLLLRAEKFPEIKQRLLRLTSGAIPCGPTWTHQRMIDYFHGAADVPEGMEVMGLPFDAYTQNYYGPHLVEPKDYKTIWDQVRITGNTTRFKLPRWNVGEDGAYISEDEEEERWQWRDVDDD